MKKIVYYISDNGFGHAARGIALIRELVQNSKVKIIIKTGRPLSFMQESLSEFADLEFIYSENDVGLVLKENSLQVNHLKLQRKLQKWVDDWSQLISNETKFLHKEEVDLVISDITPWPFLATRQAGVRSIGISNFTWYEIYKDLLGQQPIVERIGQAYEMSDLLFQFPLNLDIERIDNLQEVGFVSRKIDNEKVRKIKERISPNKKLIYVGVGKSVDLGLLNSLGFQEFNHYNWLFSTGAPVEGKNIYTIPETVTETQNYIAACDYAITKPGWSTVTEAIIGNTLLLLIERNGVIEDRVITEKIKELGLGLSLSKKEFINLEIENKLKELNLLCKNIDRYENKVEEIADRIITTLKER